VFIYVFIRSFLISAETDYREEKGRGINYEKNEHNKFSLPHHMILGFETI